MNILIIGGRKKADFLIKSLLTKRNKVTLIHDDQDFCKEMSRKYNATIIWGDGSKTYILEEAQIQKQDIVIAITPKDCNNLVICELAKKVYGIQKTFATVHNPKNVDVFKKLGISSTISATYVVSDMIEQLATINELSNLIPIEAGNISLMEIIMKTDYQMCNLPVKKINFSTDTIIGCITRGSKMIIPKGDTIILPDDKLVILTTSKNQNSIIEKLIGEPHGKKQRK